MVGSEAHKLMDQTLRIQVPNENILLRLKIESHCKYTVTNRHKVYCLSYELVKQEKTKTVQNI